MSSKIKIGVIVSWILRSVAAIILLQTLYFKFTGHPESVAIFSKLGIEPWGRIGTGILELIASLLLLIPSTVFVGAFLAAGLMGGAIFSHLTVIGIESNGDGGQLFMLACIVLSVSLTILFIHRLQGVSIMKRFFGKGNGRMNTGIN